MYLHIFYIQDKHIYLKETQVIKVKDNNDYHSEVINNIKFKKFNVNKVLIVDLKHSDDLYYIVDVKSTKYFFFKLPLQKDAYNLNELINIRGCDIHSIILEMYNSGNYYKI